MASNGPDDRRFELVVQLRFNRVDDAYGQRLYVDRSVQLDYAHGWSAIAHVIGRFDAFAEEIGTELEAWRGAEGKTPTADGVLAEPTGTGGAGETGAPAPGPS